MPILTLHKYSSRLSGCIESHPLGLSNGGIRNYQISASSYLSSGSTTYLPSQARLGIRSCWCGNYAGQQNWLAEWIQVVFERPVVIKAIATQGNPHKSTSFVKKFFLEFSDDGITFYPVNDTAGARKEFIGNTDNTGIKFNWLTKTSSTRYVRFRALDLNDASDGTVCLRMEFYGCNSASDEATKYGSNLFPLGIENGNIKDSAISSSSQIVGKEAKLARLNHASGWCALSDADQWLQVDLGRQLSVRAIAIQGLGAKNSHEIIETFQVSHSLSSQASSFKFIEDFPGKSMLFSSDAKTSQDPFMALFPNSIIARYIKIIPKTKGAQSTMFCVRIELFGDNQKCYKGIAEQPGNVFSSSSVKTGSGHANAFLFFANSWCANASDVNQFIKIEFPNALEINGIAIQGDAKDSNWVKSFKIRYKPQCATEIQLPTLFNGNSDQHGVMRHWFASSIKVDHLLILPLTWNNNICLRFQIIGCGCTDDLKRVPLGMQNGFIPTSRTFASSKFNDDLNFGPGQGRIGMNTRWCGNKTGVNSFNDFHQVDFGKIVILTGIATQGDPAFAANYVKKFYLETANFTSSFSSMKTCSIAKEFIGNTDHTNIKYNYFGGGVVTRFIRFRAMELARTDNNRLVCVRLEYYGMQLYGYTDAESKGLYALGMENGIIQNSQLTASSEYNGNSAAKSRLGHPHGWCSGTTNDGWLQITFPYSVTITAVSLQGHGGHGSPDRTYKYHVQYYESNTWKNVKDFNSVDKLFIGNKDTSRDPVVDFLPTPLTVDKLRINPYVLGTGSSLYCLRTEIYGYHSVCSDDLTNSADTLITGSSYESIDYSFSSFFNNPLTWCANPSDSSPYLLVNLGSPKTITGFGVQGDSNADNWPTEVKISYGNKQCCLTELTEVFEGNGDRNRVVLHWFTSLKIGQFLKIKITTSNGRKCIRIQVLGCDTKYGRPPLGMTNGLIKNSQITATSRYRNDWRWDGSTGRLRVTGNRWCSAQPLNYQDYLQVDFRRIVTLTGIATQGDDGYNHYVKKFYLQVSLDGATYNDVANQFCQRQNFTGNSDNTGIVYNWLAIPTRARYVRFRATDINGLLICARLEYYGAANDQAADKSLYPLGMENGVIEDSQLTSSNNLPNDLPRYARLWHAKGWCAPNGNNNEWLQIDLKQQMVISAVATQSLGGLAIDMTYKYYLLYNKSSSGLFEYVSNVSTSKMLFTGNKPFKNLPVLNFLPIPVTSQFLRINPIEKGGANVRCLRAEIYGYHPECSDDLTILNDARITASSSKSGKFPYTATVNSANAWCPASASLNEYIQIDLGHIHRITGIGIQGDLDNDFWPKKFKISHGYYSGCLKEVSKEYIANSNRHGITRHWFSDMIFAQFIRIRVTSFNGAGPTCLRFQILELGRTPLGMSNGLIKNDQITATSEFTYAGISSPTWFGSTGRLRVTGNRWCSAQPLNYQEYLQVDFRRIVTLTGIATQGDDGYNTYVKKFYLQVSLDGATYNDVTNQFCQRQIFTGNINNNGIVYNWLPVPTRARYVRFRATDVQGLHICARLEYYSAANDQAADKSLYPLGMESGVIEDSQLTSSGYLYNEPPQTARLWKPRGWCAPNGNNNEWLQIDLKQQMVISAVATQSFDGGGFDMTYKYYLLYNKSSSGLFEYVSNVSASKMLFTGNKPLKNLPVLNFLPIPVTTQFLRINPIEKGGATIRCLRAEIYGYHPVCFDDLTNGGVLTASTSLSTNPSRNVFINTMNTWCAQPSDTNGHIDVMLSSARIISAVGIQGDSDNDYWVKTFNISYSLDNIQYTELSKTFIGNQDRNTVVRNWLLPPVFAKYIRIKADTFNIKLCARIQAIGCSKDYAVISGFNVRVYNMRNITFQWNTIHSSSSNFTVQYRKTGFPTWTHVRDVATSQLTLTSLAEKYKKYEKLTQDEILDSDIQGIIIYVSCTGNIQTRPCNNFGSKEYNITNPQLETFKVSSLASWTNYTIKLQVYNGDKRGDLSAAFTVVTAKEAPRVAPVISSVFVNNKTIKLTIEAYNEEQSDGKLLGYHILHRCIQTEKTRDCHDLNWISKTYYYEAHRTSFTISGLTTWTKYEVEMQIFSSAGSSPISASYNATTKETEPSTAPSNITCVAENATSIAVSWAVLRKDDRNGIITNYILIVSKSSTFSLKTVDVSQTLYTLTGLKPFTNYSIKIAAATNIGPGPYSDWIIKQTREAAPSKAPTIQKFSTTKFSTTITVENIKKEDKNGIILGYKISYRCLSSNRTGVCKSSSAEIRHVLGTGTASILLDGLKAWTRYSIKIAVYTTAGAGPFSAENITTTSEHVPTLPLQPMIENPQKNSIKLSWKDPSQRRGVLTRFQIKVSGKKDYNSTFNHSFEIRDNCGVTCRTYTIKGLTPGTSYTFQVSVSTSIGFGPYSEQVAGDTLISEPPKPLYTTVSKFRIGGNEENVTLYSVTNLYGHIVAYQVIVERIISSTAVSRTSFPNLRKKTEARQHNLTYYLATEKLADEMPILMQFQPGVAYVEAFNADLDTPGNYYLHFRAASQTYGKPNSPRLFGATTVYHLERTLLKQLPKPEKVDIGFTTIKFKVSVTLPQGFIVKYYYIIAVEVLAESNLNDPSSYQDVDLKKYDPKTYQPGTPYIAAVLNSIEYDRLTHFTLGDGKTSKVISSRRKRQTRALNEEYVNTVLKPDKFYSVFLRAVSTSLMTMQTQLHLLISFSYVHNAGSIVTIVTGVCVSIVVVIVGVVLFFLIRRRKKNHGKHQSVDDLNEVEEHEMSTRNQKRERNKLKANVSAPALPCQPRNLKVFQDRDFPLFAVKDIVRNVRNKSSMYDAGFKEEFQNLPKSQLFTWDAATMSNNKQKNRYGNIIPYDFNRVKLVTSSDKSDYINASFITDYHGNQRYIITQAPTSKTMGDFWMMVWQQEIPAIVMLTKCLGRNEGKSDEYWSPSGRKKHGDIKVAFLGSEKYPECTISAIELQNATTVRTCKHIHYTAWPDRDLPIFPTTLLSLRRRLRQLFPYDSLNSKPIMIHCSTGVGRTGIFIAIDTLIQLIREQGKVDVFNYVNLLMMQRFSMVQNEVQYKFIYNCLLEEAVCDVTEVSTEDFKQRFHDLTSQDRKTGQNGFQREFSSLSLLASEVDEQEYSCGRRSYISHKNRDATVLPRNTQRVLLPVLKSVEASEYINAVFVDGGKKDQFIATQSPLESSIADFWRMVIHHGSSIIVSLTHSDEAYTRYFPKKKQAKYGDGQLTISIQFCDEIGKDIILRKFVATDHMFNKTSTMIHHYSMNSWPDHSIPESILTLSQLISEVDKIQQTFGGGPIIINCSNGAGRTGTFIAAYMILEILKTEQWLDIFQVVRRMRTTRPEFIENWGQYKLLYDVVKCYLEQSSTYYSTIT
eukprot:gene17289-19017_t